MTILDASLGRAAFGAGKQDAYMRILNWEAIMTRRRGVSRLTRYIFHQVNMYSPLRSTTFAPRARPTPVIYGDNGNPKVALYPGR